MNAAVAYETLDQVLLRSAALRSRSEAVRARARAARGQLLRLRLRSAVAPESLIRDHEGNLVDHDDYVALIEQQLVSIRRRQAARRTADALAATVAEEWRQ